MPSTYEVLSPNGHYTMAESIFAKLKAYMDAHGPGSKVDRAGDTMTGALNLNNTSVVVIDTNIDSNVTPSSSVWGDGYYLKCASDTSSNEPFGYFRAIKITNGDQGVQLETNRYISGTRYMNSLRLLINSSGNNIVELADASAWRTALGLGTMATQASTSYVAKSGDTMSGNLTQTKVNTSYYISKTNTYAKTTASNNGVTSNTDMGGLLFRDKNDSNLGDVHVYMDSNGSVRLELYTQNMKTDGTAATNAFNIITNKDGSATYSMSSAANFRSAISCPAMVTDSYATLLPTNASNGWIKFGTSNTTYGILPSASGGQGSGHNHIGTSSWYWKYSYIDHMYSQQIDNSSSVVSKFLQSKATNQRYDTGGQTNSYGNGGMEFYDSNSARTGFINWHKVADLDVQLRMYSQSGGTYCGIWCGSRGTLTYYGVSNATAFRSAIGAAASSSRLTKKNIEDITEEEAKKILNINVKSFDYKDNFIDNSIEYNKQYGIIAEDVMNDIPYVVNIPKYYKESDFDEKYGLSQRLLTIDYAKFVPYLIKMIQIQQKEIHELKSKIA